MSQVVRFDARKGATFVQALDLRLDRETAERVGRVYGLLAADTKGRKGEALAAHLEDAFVRGAAEAVRKLPGDAPQDQLFEAAISRANHALNRLFGEFGLDVEPERITSAIIAVKEHDVVAATWGRPNVLLYHPLPSGAARAFDLVDDSKAEPAAPFKTANVRRCFGSIIAGRMGKRDRLLVCTHDLRAYLGEEKLLATIVANEPDGAAAIIDQLLSPLEQSMAVAALVIDVTEVRYVENDPSLAPAAAKQAPSGTGASIAKLLKTQHEAAETLAPSLIGDMAKKVSGLFGHGHEAAPQPAAKTSEPVAAPTAVAAPQAAAPAAAPAVPAAPEPAKPSPVVTALAKGAKAAGRGAAVAGKASWSFLAAMANKEKRRAAIQGLREGADKGMNGLVDRYNGLTTFSRVLFFMALSLVIVAKGGVAVASWNRAQEEKVAAYERKIAAVEQKIDSAEASMIYRDEARAKELLVEASAAIDALPAQKPEELATNDGLRKKIAAGYETLRREVKLPEPEILASITSATGTPELAKLATAAEGFIWGVSTQGEVFKVGTDGAVEKVADAPGGAAPGVFLAQGNDVFAASADGKGTFVTSRGKASARDVELDGSIVADAGLYNAKLYVLDPSHSRIMRHPAGDAGYGKPQFYLKDGTDLSQGVSIAIDGAVYVLRRDGSIVRIVKGLQEPFNVAAADPPVTAPLRLRTEDENGDLFVLDGNPSRILRFNKKNGVLIGQYVSDSLKGASDFTVDAKGKTAIVAVKNQLLKFSLPDAK